MPKHVNIMVSGKVQGVFYRASTREKAEALGVKGFVRNERDGSVYVEAEGEEENLNRFIAWCKTGPPGSSVHKVDVISGELKGFTRFEVKGWF